MMTLVSVAAILGDLLHDILLVLPHLFQGFITVVLVCAHDVLHKQIDVESACR